MKGFIGFLLRASLAVALVDEKEATPSVPESQKTDLLITANGQTIKLNTDGNARNAIGLAANRFKLGQAIGGANHRRMQTEEEGDEPAEVTPEEVENVNQMIADLKEKLDAAGPEDRIDMSRARVQEIINMLETFVEVVEDEPVQPEEPEEPFSGPDDGSVVGGVSSRRRSRQMRHYHSRRNQGFVKRGHVWGRRQSVVHRSNFGTKGLYGVQRIVVNP